MDYNTQDTRSFDSYVSTPTTPSQVPMDYFTVLPLIATVRRTSQLAATFGLRRFVPWTAMCLSPSVIVASFTALFHVSKKITDPVQLYTMTPFDEIWQALPLVLWHVLVLAVGATAAQCVMVRFLAEFYARRAIYTSLRTSLWTTALRHGSMLCQAALFIIGSLTVVYLVGHVLTVGLVDLRTNANKVHDKDPFLFGTIATAAVIIMLVLDGFVLFAVIWLAVMYTTTLPIILLEQTASPIDVFRVAYVLARDSRSYLALSWAMASLPGLLVSAIIGWPWHAATRQPQQDFVEWQLGTVAGIWALYLPMLVWLPLLSMYVCTSMLQKTRCLLSLPFLSLYLFVLSLSYFLDTNFAVTKPSCT